jgi:hypothetical protein
MLMMLMVSAVSKGTAENVAAFWADAVNGDVSDGICIDVDVDVVVEVFVQAVGADVVDVVDAVDVDIADGK